MEYEDSNFIVFDPLYLSVIGVVIVLVVVFYIYLRKGK